MGIGYRIKEAREKLGFTQTELGKLVGVTGSAITNYENETSHPKEPVMYKLIETLKVDANYLFQDCVKLPKEANDITLLEYEHIKKYRFIIEHSPDGAKMVDAVLDRENSIAKQLKAQAEHIKELERTASQNDTHNSNTRLINYYYRLTFAGTGQIVFDTPPTKRIEIPDIPKYEKVDYAIGINGNSMEPIYHDGDTLLIEMTEEIQPGEIGLFLVDGESYIKKLGNDELISLNPEYENISLTKDSLCLGRVLYVLA